MSSLNGGSYLLLGSIPTARRCKQESCGRSMTKSGCGSGGALVFKYFHFAQSARADIKNDAAHGDVFGNPRMRPDHPNLLPGIFLGVLVGEEAHWSRRRITRRSAQLRVQFLIRECREPAASVVENQYLPASEYTVGNDNFRENIFCYRGSAGSDHVDIGLRQTRIAGRSERRGSIQVTTTIWGQDASPASDRNSLHSCGLLLVPYR